MLLVLILTACGGATTVPSASVTAAPTLKPIITPAPTQTPEPTPDNSTAARVVERLDELGILALTGDGDIVGEWANEEGEWVVDHMAGLMADPALADYVTNILALLEAVSDGSDQTDAVVMLLGMRNDIATSVGLPTEAISTPPPTPKPTATPKPISYAKVAKRTWAKIVKSPDSYVGKGFRLWACIVQFDAATGPDSFRAMASYRKEPYWYTDGVNTFFNGTESKLADFVQDDVVAMRVVGEGSYSYDTQNGGNTTAPQFRVVGIERSGSCD